MSQDNLVSISISAEDDQAITDALQVLQDKLQPYLIALTPDDRRKLPKMSNRTIPFVQKSLEYAETNTQFAPVFVDIPEMKKDVEAVNKLTQYFRIIDELHEHLDDTVMLAGSEAYVAALAFYNSVKLASKMKQQGAEPIYDDLKERFK